MDRLSWIAIGLITVSATSLRVCSESLLGVSWLSNTVIFLSTVILASGVAWIGNRFRCFVSAKITTGHRISERQFWLAPIKAHGQALEIVRRASRDFIGLCVCAMFPMIPGAPDALIGMAIIVSPVFLLTLLAGRRSRIAAALLLGIILSANIALLALGIPSSLEVCADLPHLAYLQHYSTSATSLLYVSISGLIYYALIVLPFALASLWMACRTFQATRAMRVLG